MDLKSVVAENQHPGKEDESKKRSLPKRNPASMAKWGMSLKRFMSHFRVLIICCNHRDRDQRPETCDADAIRRMEDDFLAFLTYLQQKESLTILFSGEDHSSFCVFGSGFSCAALLLRWRVWSVKSFIIVIRWLLGDVVCVVQKLIHLGNVRLFSNNIHQQHHCYRVLGTVGDSVNE